MDACGQSLARQEDNSSALGHPSRSEPVLTCLPPFHDLTAKLKLRSTLHSGQVPPTCSSLYICETPLSVWQEFLSDKTLIPSLARDYICPSDQSIKEPRPGAPTQRRILNLNLNPDNDNNLDTDFIIHHPHSPPKVAKVASSTSNFDSTSSSFSNRPVQSHHRRRSSASEPGHRPSSLHLGAQSQTLKPQLSPIPGTPSAPMSLSRSPSPIPGGGWSSPGLMNGSGRSTPSTNYFSSGQNGNNVSWESARMKSKGVSNYPSFSTQNQGFFTRHMRRISSSLPVFHNPDQHRGDRPAARWNIPLVARIRGIIARIGRKWRMRLLLIGLLLFCYMMFYITPLHYYWRRASNLGGGEKFVIVLGANVGGGVMEWKGAREWAIERDSVRNKRKYVGNWGYELDIVDLSHKKRYAHEWRESWEKVDSVRNAFHKYPKAEWVWWLDLNTYIMEPTYSLQDHIFNELEKHIYRDINEFNPLNITHPIKESWLDEVAMSPVGDGDINSVNLILPQDCSGFNLGSFFMRRSDWTEQLLDVWWDPVMYEQKHMEWAHKEQDALEQLYRTQPWVRAQTGFIHQRRLNSFPEGACQTEDGTTDERFHYSSKDRDFMVNMAGCEFGRDCWGEMYNFRELGYYLNRNPWERFKEDLIAVIWFKLTGQKVKL